MTTLEIDVGQLEARKVEFTKSDLVVTLADGRKIATPLAWYPQLEDATAEERANFEIMPWAFTGRTSARTWALPAC